MSDKPAYKSVTDISGDLLDEAAEVLALAFEDDPLVRYMLTGPGNTYFSKVRELFRFICEIRLELGYPLIGTMNDSRLTGVACVSVSEKQTWSVTLAEKQEKLNASLGNESMSRMDRFLALSGKYAPNQPHHYLAAIGVHPEFQGRGSGRLLLDAVREMSASQPDSTGVYLETARLKNVELYQHFGYYLVTKDRLDDTVDLWYMFRPDDSRL